MLSESIRLCKGVDHSIFDIPEIASMAYHVDNDYVDYVSAKLGHANLGAFMIVKNTPDDFDIHFLIPRSSKRYIRVLTRLILDYIFDNYKCYRLTGWIKARKWTMVNLGIKFGFIVEGVKRGKGENIFMIGLIREDWERLNGRNR